MTKQSIFALTVQAGADFQALSISSKQCKPTAGTSYQIERSHESDLLAVPLVAGSEASAGAAAVLLAAGVAAVLLAAGAAEGRADNANQHDTHKVLIRQQGGFEACTTGDCFYDGRNWFALAKFLQNALCIQVCSTRLMDWCVCGCIWLQTKLTCVRISARRENP